MDRILATSRGRSAKTVVAATSSDTAAAPIRGETMPVVAATRLRIRLVCAGAGRGTFFQQRNQYGGDKQHDPE